VLLGSEKPISWVIAEEIAARFAPGRPETRGIEDQSTPRSRISSQDVRRLIGVSRNPASVRRSQTQSRKGRVAKPLVNYAETLVRPAEAEDSLQAATNALGALKLKLIAPTPAIALDAARHRALNISLADGFALATAQAHKASIATFDRRVRRALPKVELELASQLHASR
jgi:predicted nucleic acid-binding protein